MSTSCMPVIVGSCLCTLFYFICIFWRFDNLFEASHLFARMILCAIMCAFETCSLS